MKELNWYGLYSDSWQGEIVPEAFSHPAKYSRALIRKIYQHMLESGWIKPGDKVVDPFGGVALGAYHAMQNGLVWCGCELEPKFVNLGNQNIALWNGRYAPHFAKWGTAVLIQGDSRNLVKNIQGEMNGAVSSAPFIENNVNIGAVGDTPAKRQQIHNSEKREKSYGQSNGQLGSMPEGSHDAAISSSPFGAGETRNRSEFQGGEIASMMSRAYTQDKQGVTAGNLAHLETKESDFQAAVTSPVYAETVKNGEGTGVRYDPKSHKGDNAYKATSQAAYGKSNGQLGQMNGNGFEAAVSSSPFEAGTPTNQRPCKHTDEYKMKYGHIGSEKLNQHDYGDHPANVGNETGETFWTAARQIVEQTYQVLKPGAYTAWVCGDFIRNKQRVYFGRQWMELCEAVGFEPVEWAIAWKTEYKGNQLDVFSNDHEKRIDRVSFFRRLANNKSHANEYWKTIPEETKNKYIDDLTNELWNEYQIILDSSEPEYPHVINVENLWEYKIKLEKYKELSKQKKNLKHPTEKKILDYAKMAAWVDDQCPQLSEATVLNEDVIFMRKPL